MARKQRFIREKIALVISSTATREWPQHWPSLVQQLLAVAQKSASAAHVVVLVLRNLAEEVRSFNPKLPNARRKQLQQGLSQHLPQLYPFIVQMLLVQCNAYKAGHTADREAAVATSVECVGSFLDFSPAQYAFQPQLISLLCQLLKMPVFFESAMEVMHGLAQRKRSKLALDTALKDQMLPVWPLVVGMMGAVAQQTFAEQNGVEQQEVFMKKCLSLLHKMLKNWRGDIKGSTTGMEQFRHRLLAQLGLLVAHRSVAISTAAVDVFQYLFRFTRHDIIGRDMQPQLVGSLFQVVVKQVVKKEKADLSDNIYLEEAMESATLDKVLGDYRSCLLSLAAKMALREPLGLLRLLGQRFGEVLSEAPDPSDARNTLGYLTVHSRRYRKFEAACVLLESILRTIPGDEFSKTPPTELCKAAQALLAGLLGFKTGDPLMKHRLLTALTYFCDLYRAVPNVLPGVLSFLFAHVVFVPHREKDVPLQQLSEDVSATRKRAGSTLMTIGAKVPSALISGFNSCVQSVIALVRRSVVTDPEKLLLYEFLVAVTNAMPDYEQQHAFVCNILSDSLNQWKSTEVQSWMTQPVAFAQLLLPPSRPQRRMLKGVLSALLAVLHRLPLSAEQQQVQQRLARGGQASSTALPLPVVGGVVDQKPHPSAAILYSIIPGVLRLTATLHALWTPEGKSSLPVESRQILQLSMVERKVYLGEKALKAERQSDPSSGIRSWINQVRDAAYRLLARGVLAGPAFYSQHSAQALGASVFSHMEHMEHWHLKMLLDRFCLPFVEKCPLHAFNSTLGPLLRGVLVVMFSRLSAEWARVGSAPAVEAQSGDAVRDDILTEKALRDCTRSYADMLMRVLEVLEFSPESKWRAAAAALRGQGEDVPDKPPEQKQNGDVSKAPSHGDLVLKFILSTAALAPPFVASLAGLVCWRDSHANVRAGHISLHIIPMCANNAVVHPMLAELGKACLHRLMSMRKADLDLGDNIHMQVVRELFLLPGSFHQVMRQVFVTVPGVEPAHVQNLEQGLDAAPTDRKHMRRIFKSFLTSCVIGIKSAFKASKEAEIHNLPENLVLLARRVSDEPQC